MPDFCDEETKACNAKYDALRTLLSDIGTGKLPLRSVVPQLMVTPTGTEEVPEVTVALLVVTVKGATPLEALTNMESALRISAFGTHTDAVNDDVSLIDVTIPEAPEETTLAELAAENFDATPGPGDVLQ